MNRLLSVLLVSCFVAAAAAEPAAFERTRDVIYHRKFGTALTFDVFKPKQPNAVGIVFIVSGGWFSSTDSILPASYQTLLDRGYTVFAVVHGSQPKFHIPEIIEDIRRATRFIRAHAGQYGIDPHKLGVTGGSAGGHLSLLLAAQGEPGKPDAADPIDRQSSAVQCVACFFPPTDFLNYGAPGQSALGEGVLANFKSAFGEIPNLAAQREEYGRKISPIYFVSSNMPPALIIHGDADKLVPIQQAESFVEKCKASGVPAKLVPRERQGHGWKNWLDDFAVFADWFDEHLRGMKQPAAARANQ